MATATRTRNATSAKSATKMGEMFGRLYAFNTSLKLYHWHVTGKGSYAQHMAIDQALESLADAMDRIVETSYAKYGEVMITVPKTEVPNNLVSHCQDFYQYVEDSRDYFTEDFSDSIIDDWQEAVQQLLYRLMRLQ